MTENQSTPATPPPSNPPPVSDPSSGSATSSATSSVLLQLLTPENVEILRADLQRWEDIINKKAINVIIVGKRPDQSVDTTRRDGLVRMMLVLKELFAEHDRATASAPAGEPGLGGDLPKDPSAESA
jgi:hypothetical protein